MKKLGFYPGAADPEALERLRETWERQYRYGTLEARREREAAWEPYYSLIYRTRLGQPWSFPAERSPAVRVLLEEGLLGPEKRVLDIGCGTGETALELTRFCGTVTAMDSNETAVRVLRERCDSAGIGNLEALCASWNDGPPEGEWDLAITSMCPAVCNPEELLAMESCARETCALVTVMKGSADKYRGLMMRELGLRPAGMITEYGTYLDVLRALGRDVTVWTDERFTERKTSLEELLRQFPTYFEIFGICREDAEAYLKAFFEKHQQDGFLHDETRMNTALLCWKPERRGGGSEA